MAALSKTRKSETFTRWTYHDLSDLPIVDHLDPIYITCRYESLCRRRIVQLQSGNDALDHADYSAPTPQDGLDYTDHAGQSALYL